MKTRKTKWLRRAGIFTGILAAVIAFFWLLGLREPSYDGRRVSYWFREYCYSGQFMGGMPDWSRHQECAAALKATGTNAVPYLVKQAFNNRPPSATLSKFEKFLNSLPPALHLPRPATQWAKSAESVDALKEIRPPAAQMLELLQPHLNATNIFEHRMVLSILGTCGDGAEQAVPSLTAALKEQDNWTRGIAIQSLGWIGPRAGAATPALIEVMQEPRGSNYNGVSAAVALGTIGGSNTLPAAPMIKELFEKEKNWNLKGCIGAALMKTDPTQTEVLDFLTSWLTNRNATSDKWMAASYLAQIGPAAKVAAPVLLQTLSDTNMFVTHYSADALKEIGMAPEVIVSHMNGGLKSMNDTERFDCADEVMRIDPANQEAHQVMTDLISRHTPFEAQAIDYLNHAGPPAADTLPLLRKIAKESTDPDIRKRALRAVKRIEGPPK